MMTVQAHIIFHMSNTGLLSVHECIDNALLPGPAMTQQGNHVHLAAESNSCWRFGTRFDYNTQHRDRPAA